MPDAHDVRDSPSPESMEVGYSHNSPPNAARRFNSLMVGGIHISNEEGVRWFEKTYGRELSKDHREDASVRMELEGFDGGGSRAAHSDAENIDFVADTHEILSVSTIDIDAAHQLLAFGLRGVGALCVKNGAAACIKVNEVLGQKIFRHEEHEQKRLEQRRKRVDAAKANGGQGQGQEQGRA
ncbi:hypothetical protein K438DRAFT_2012512 [Mycena galopus ATCC 62051]|nr:hypothetical protein K438DRAFT_2012512 [Mycena galopus ATCC 62051]